MGQSAPLRLPGIFSAAIVSVLLGGIIFTTGCDRGSAGSQSTSSSPTSRPAKVTVASLSPAATDLLIGMNLSDRLVAVSNYDRDRDGTRGLPRVGDYQTTDWERLALLRPGVMVTQFAAAVPVSLLREKVASLQSNDIAIGNAIDMLLAGY